MVDTEEALGAFFQELDRKLLKEVQLLLCFVFNFLIFSRSAVQFNAFSVFLYSDSIYPVCHDLGTVHKIFNSKQRNQIQESRNLTTLQIINK